MLRNTIVLGFSFFIISATTAFADQAIWIKKSDADKALQMIHPGMTVRKYCAPCGDSTWTSLTVKEVKVNQKEKDFFEVNVNGEGIDLAYIYIENQGRWRNLAMMLNLNVADVPEYLEAGKDNLPSKDSEQNNTNKIDKILDSCIAKDNSTAGMTNCIHESYELWDAELNTLYNQLKELLNQDQKKDLKQAQSEWIKYRDAEFKLIDSIYSSLQGTMFTPMRAGDRVEIVKKRTLELESYIELMKIK